MREFVHLMIAYAKVNKHDYIWIVLFASVILVLLFVTQKKRMPKNASKKRSWFCDVCFSLECAFIYVMTLFARDTVEGTWSMWRPLQSYRMVWSTGDVELFLQIVINIIMLVPFGFLLPCCFMKFNKCWEIVLMTFSGSLMIELLQAFLQIGLFETDDIINNVFGASIGYGIYTLIKKRKIVTDILKRSVEKLSNTRFVILLSMIWQSLTWIEYLFFRGMWFLTGKKKPTVEEVKLVCENVTFFYKSFERQNMAKRLYKNIQSYYPGVKVVIADDSSKPLELTGDNLEIIQLPFNSGLSRGLNKALERVDTPFVVRMDDDQLLTPFTKIHEQILFLQEHVEVDLVGILLYHMPKCRSLYKATQEYYKQPMNYAPKALIIPHLTEIDDRHIVVGKSSNTFVARTDKLKEIGYDDNIRMIDHNEFFYRAAGNIVSVLDKSVFVLHYRNRFDMHYNKYRSDYEGDRIYIQNKMRNNIIKSK